jgi:hypothetical protein
VAKREACPVRDLKGDVFSGIRENLRLREFENKLLKKTEVPLGKHFLSLTGEQNVQKDIDR